MTDTTPKAWLCKHCSERVDPTMDLCWSCGCDRDGQQAVKFSGDDQMPFATCPQCMYDLRGNLNAEVCPECGTTLRLSGAHKELYWVPSTTKIGAIAKLFRNPLRMIPIAIFAWMLVGVMYTADEEMDFFVSHNYVSNPAEFLTFISIVSALFFTFAVIGGTIVQGLQPPDDEQIESSVSQGQGFILRWLTRGWGRFIYWIVWGSLLVSILLFYSQ